VAVLFFMLTMENHVKIDHLKDKFTVYCLLVEEFVDCGLVPVVNYQRSAPKNRGVVSCSHGTCWVGCLNMLMHFLNVSLGLTLFSYCPYEGCTCSLKEFERTFLEEQSQGLLFT
jgi:hypothetical protein